MEKIERIVIAHKLMMEPEEVIVDVAPVLVAGEGAETHPLEIYAGVIPVGTQVPRRVEFPTIGVVVFPTHPGPVYPVADGVPLLQPTCVLELEGGNEGTQPNTVHEYIVVLLAGHPAALYDAE